MRDLYHRIQRLRIFALLEPHVDLIEEFVAMIDFRSEIYEFLPSPLEANVPFSGITLELELVARAKASTMLSARKTLRAESVH